MAGPVQTLLALILGAVLAAVGGFAATQVGIWIDRSRRAKDAALWGGEILAGVGTLRRLAEAAGFETNSLIHWYVACWVVARREIDVYDRNSDLLFSFVNADLKAGLHGFIIRDFIIRFSILLDRLADGHARYLEPCSIGLTPPPQAEELRKAKDLNFIYLTKSRNLIPGLLALLQALIQLPGINSCLSYLASHCSRRRGSSE
jgi:hypothetical protein